MSISSEITRINTNIANSYTAVDNKNGTLPQVQNSANLSTAIDSIEVIESATAEGESLSLVNTKAIPYNDYIVKGKSEQATSTQSANLFDENYYNNADLYSINVYKYTLTRIKGNRTLYVKAKLKEGKSNISGLYVALSSTPNPNSGTYKFFVQNGTANADSFNTTGITDLYFSIYPTMIVADVFDTYNFWVSTNDIDYVPFTPDSPSPDYPSEIHSVADDVNLVDESLITEYENRGLRWKYDTESKKIKVTETATSTYSQTDRYSIDLPAGTYIFTAYTESNLRFNVWLYNSNGTLIGNTSTNNPVTINENATKFAIFCEGTSSGTTYNEELNVKLQKGTTSTPYSPYNQGTVTIKQRGKNLLDVGDTSDYTGSGIRNLSIQNNEISNVIDSGGASYIIQNNKLNINNFCFSGTYDRTGVEPRFLVRAYNSNNEQITSSVSGWTYNSYYNAYYKDENGNFNLSNVSYVKVGLAWKGTQGETGKYSNIQLEQGSSVTTYKPYQANDFTFQTEPLRSLPNGVKDTIEADGIHRRVGRVVLDDVIELYEATILGTQGKFASYGLQNVKNENRNYNFISDKLTYANEQFVKYGAYRNQTVLIVLTTIDDTLENFNSKISGSEVLYELAEEIIEPLTQNQATTMLDIIKTGSYEGTTNIDTDEDVKPTIGVDYYKKG